MARSEDDEDGDGGPGGLSLDRVLLVLQRRWRPILVFALFCGGLAAGVVLAMPDRYDASAFVQIDPRKKTITNLENVVSEIKADTASIESEVEVIRSRAIALRVIDVLDLRNDPEFAKAPSRWSALLGMLGMASGDNEARRPPRASEGDDPIGSILAPVKPGSSTPERDEVAVAFAERLRVVRVRNTLLIDIRFSAADAVKAAKIANTIAEVYLAEQLDSKQRAAGVAMSVLEDKLESLRRRVADSERRIEVFKAEHNIFDSEGQILSEKQLARLMEQTVIARNATAEAKAKYEQVERLRKRGEGPADIADVLQSHTVRLLKEQLGKATRNAAELLTRYGPRHPEMQKARAEVAEAEGQLRAEIDSVLANLKNELEVAEERERQLAANLTALKAQQATSKEAGVQLKELERDAATSKQLFEALLTRYKQTAETRDMQLPDSRIVEQADVPLFPAAPKRKQIVVIVTFCGLLAALAMALAAEFLTPGLGRPEDAEHVLELPHLTSLPQVYGPHDLTANALKSIRLVLAEPHSPFAEAVRAMRREIDVRSEPDAPRVILTASSLPGEQAGIVASNLAHHYALTGHSVLLIDGDLRRCALTRELAGGRSSGLAECLFTGRPVEEAILRDQRTGLHFLPSCGPVPAQVSGAELLASRAMGRTLERLREQFDVIVIDAPPLLPVIDGRILADLADQIVFVMAWRRTPKQLAKRALKTLGRNHGKIAGVVVSDVDPELVRRDGLGPEDPGGRGPLERRAA
jgi:exopolysaccharide transport family protein